MSALQNPQIEVVKINGASLEVVAHDESWAISNKEVALGFGVEEATIRSQKSRGEYKDGVHFYVLQNATGNAEQTMWTKKGVITLGFKLRETPQTIAFRDWASDYLLNPVGSLPQPKNISQHVHNITDAFNYINDVLPKLKRLKEIESNYYERVVSFKMQLNKMRTFHKEMGKTIEELSGLEKSLKLEFGK